LVAASEGAMRPKQRETSGSNDLLRARLEQIINMKHELVVLAGKIERLCSTARSRRGSVILINGWKDPPNATDSIGGLATNLSQGLYQLSKGCFTKTGVQ
jgi:hypothetical protein